MDAENEEEKEKHAVEKEEEDEEEDEEDEVDKDEEEEDGKQFLPQLNDLQFVVDSGEKMRHAVETLWRPEMLDALDERLQRREKVNNLIQKTSPRAKLYRH